VKGHILLVEDDADLVRGLCFNLRHEGYEVTAFAKGGPALSEIRRGACDLVLLDLNLPDRDGLDVLRELRADGVAVPVICLTARGQETDIVMGLGLGADDYVPKPFGVAELLARIDALLRRSGGALGETLRLGDVEIDLDARRARHPDRQEDLTPIEIDLLRYLAVRRGTAVDRTDILRDLWGLGPFRSTRTLDNHVARLRRKLERDPTNPRHLVTVHGVGYRLEAEGTA
jgi:DNA-binding response OmpR family regulator